MLSIFLFTGLWTSLARMHFNEVSLEENLPDSKMLGLRLDGTASEL